MKPIIVLGMHRSGTSAITRAIGLLGAGMGESDRLRKHWENIPLRRVNERLLVLGDGVWDAPPERGWWESRRGRNHLVKAREAVQDQFGDEQFAVWKDPRTCLTLPFWLSVFEEEPVLLLIYRHPTEVADSLTARNNLRRGHGYAVWERYNGDALRYAQGHPTVVLDYESLVTDPVGSLGRICQGFADVGLELPGDPATVEHGLVAQERHHVAGASDAVDEGIAMPSQRELFAMLRDLDGAHAALTLPRPVPEAHPLSLELLDLARRNRLAHQKRSRAARPDIDPAEEAAVIESLGRTRVGRTNPRPDPPDADEAADDATTFEASALRDSEYGDTAAAQTARGGRVT